MDEDGELRHAIRQKVTAGKLPKLHCRMTWYGPGRQSPCVACDEPIRADDVEVECDVPTGGTIRFHQRCYDIWADEWPSLEG